MARSSNRPQAPQPSSSSRHHHQSRSSNNRRHANHAHSLSHHSSRVAHLLQFPSHDENFSFISPSVKYFLFFFNFIVWVRIGADFCDCSMLIFFLSFRLSVVYLSHWAPGRSWRSTAKRWLASEQCSMSSSTYPWPSLFSGPLFSSWVLLAASEPCERISFYLRL